MQNANPAKYGRGLWDIFVRCPNLISVKRANMPNAFAFRKRKLAISVWTSRRNKEAMSVVIGGVEPFTTVDFPGRLAAVFFCLGCTWRCPYCHNPELQPFSGMPVIEWAKIVEFLESRRKLLDGIVFSGGEPLWQDGLKR